MEDNFVKQLLGYVNTTTIALIDNIDQYKEFLRFLAGMNSNQKISNRILIHGYDPEATDVRLAEEWNRTGVSVRDDTKKIYILEYNRSSQVSYSAKEVFDIRNTDAGLPEKITFQDSGEFAETVLASAPCRVVFRDSNSSDREKCSYDWEKKEISVLNGFRDYEEIARNLLRQYAHFYIDEICRRKYVDKHKTGDGYHYSKDARMADSLSVCYMICSRYDRKLPDIPCLRRSADTSTEVIREVLDNMNEAFGKMVRKLDKTCMELRRSYEQTLD